MTTELYSDILTASGGDPASVPDNLKTTLLKEIIIAQGGSVDDLPDELETTLLKRIAETTAPPVTTEKNGASVVFNSAAAFPLIGLNIYGKSTQNGTPTPEAPADIVSVGGDGGIAVTVNDGGDNSLTASITSTLPLCGLPVTSGGNYTDGNGQQWVCDELIYGADGTGKIVRRLKLMNALDLPYSSADISGYSSAERICFYFNYIGKKTSSRAVICNRFKPGNYKETSEVNIAAVEDINLLLGVSSGIAKSVSALKTWFSENPTYILFERQTPEEVELTADEVTQLKALCSYNGVTNVFNDESAEMVVKCCTNQDAVNLVNMFG